MRLGPEALQKMLHGFHADAVAIMTPERAAFVRLLRVTRGYSWRAVADTCLAEWEPTLPSAVRENWAPGPHRVLLGMTLCAVVAALEGQHHMKRGEWN